MAALTKSHQQMRAIVARMYDELNKHDLIDHPEFFNVMDDFMREHDFMICAEQKGIFGTRIYFGRVSQYEA